MPKFEFEPQVTLATPTDRGMFHSYHVNDYPEFERG